MRLLLVAEAVLAQAPFAGSELDVFRFWVDKQVAVLAADGAVASDDCIGGDVWERCGELHTSAVTVRRVCCHSHDEDFKRKAGNDTDDRRLKFTGTWVERRSELAPTSVRQNEARKRASDWPLL